METDKRKNTAGSSGTSDTHPVGGSSSSSSSDKSKSSPSGGGSGSGGKQGHCKTSRQYREIYRPPSLRSKGSGNSSSNNNNRRHNNNNNNGGFQQADGNNGYVGSNKGGQNQNHNVSSPTVHHAPISPRLPKRPFHYDLPQPPPSSTNTPQWGPQNNNNPSSFPCPLMNANAKEFQIRQQQQEQLMSILGRLDPGLYGDMLAGLGLQQSKSLGSNLNGLLAAPPHFSATLAYHHLQSQQKLANSMGRLSLHHPLEDLNCGGFNKLSQSKSSGSIPSSDLGGGGGTPKPRVRFSEGVVMAKSSSGLDLDLTAELDEAALNMLRNSEGGLQGGFPYIGFPVVQPQLLQKSKTTASSLNMPPQHQQGILKQTEVHHSKAVMGPIKRSRSFPARPSPSSSSSHSIYSDFQISSWPPKVQEMITLAVTSAERVPARQQIQMVNAIFDAMFTSSETPLLDLTTPAVHIFLYFIQREKDRRTVMESLLNTCFATFQNLFQNPHPPSQGSGGGAVALFLRFLSSLYSQVKMLKRQKPGGGALDEMSFSVLAVLCDSCLSLLRSRLSSDANLMGTLFRVMTSQGRDMERLFPLKLKGLLAAVRDSLLGLGPYAKGLPPCPAAQRTLMQLIELHANNWALPASAVRYYYSNPLTNNND